MIVCPACRAKLRVTTMSRLAAALTALGILLAVVLLPSLAGFQLRGWQSVLLLVTCIPLYLLAWPRIVRLKPWTPFKYWLPKSRVLGYAVYLLIPVSAIILLFYFAVRFQWGM
jgi:hypothetical protein